MVNFAQGFLQDLANPAMAKSLFGAGAAIGNLPKQYQQQQRLEAYRKMSPAQQIEYNIANATTTEEIQKAQQLKINFTKREAQKAINKLEALRATSTDPVQQRVLEEKMANIAAKGGLDAKGYVGRTDAEELRALQRTAVEDAATERDRGKAELRVARAYKHMIQSDQSPEAIAIAKKIWDDGGFTSVIESIDKEALAAASKEIAHQNQLDARADREVYLSNTSPVTQLENDIKSNKNIKPSVRKVLTERIARLKSSYPDFANKGTWTTAGRRQHDSEYRAISNSYYTASVEANRRIERENERMASLRNAMAKIAAQTVNKSEWSEYTNQAEQ